MYLSDTAKALQEDWIELCLSDGVLFISDKQLQMTLLPELKKLQ